MTLKRQEEAAALDDLEMDEEERNCMRNCMRNCIVSTVAMFFFIRCYTGSFVVIDDLRSQLFFNNFFLT